MNIILVLLLLGAANAKNVTTENSAEDRAVIAPVVAAALISAGASILTADAGGNGHTYKLTDGKLIDAYKCWQDEGGVYPQCPNGNCLDNRGRRGVPISTTTVSCKFFCKWLIAHCKTQICCEQTRVVPAPKGCTGRGWNWSCCSSTNKCSVGGGDCDSNQDCKSGLFCGRDNCKQFHNYAHKFADCCTNTRCPSGSGWTRYENAVYKYFPGKLDWNSAENACRRQGANVHLVSIQSLKENKLVSKMSKGVFNFWIGGYRAQGGSKPWTGMWRWTDGSPFTYVKWDKYGNPSGDGTNLESSILNDWNDLSGTTHKRSFVCKCRLN